MKHNLSRTFRSVTSLILVLSMMFGLCGTAIAATVNEDGDVINYVSLGDSMTNGYGLPGYNEGENDDIGVNGYLQNDTNAYPAQFADYLADLEGVDAVNHTQLAISCMRAEDLRFALEFDYTDAELVEWIKMAEDKDYEEIEAKWVEYFPTYDRFTFDEFVNGRFEDYEDVPGETDKAGTAAVAEQFQTAIAEADVITIGNGNSNFGVFLLHRVIDALGIFGANSSSYDWINVEDALDDVDAETKAYVMDIYEQLKAKLPANAPEMANVLVDLITYTTISYMTNYKGALDRIAELNDGAEIMIVGLMNTMTGVIIEMEGVDADGNAVTTKINLGDYMDMVIRTMNNYLAGLPTVLQVVGDETYADHTFYFAEAEGLTKEDMFYNDLTEAAEKDWEGYAIVRDRIVSEVNSTVFPLLNAMTLENDIEEDDNPYVPIKVSDVEAYEAAKKTGVAALAQYASSTNKIQSILIYMAFEAATVKASTLNVLDANSFIQLYMGLGNVFDGVFEAFEANTEKAIEEVYWKPVVEAVVLPQLKQANLTADLDAALAYVNSNDGVKKQVTDVCTVLATPDALSAALVEDETVYGLLNLFARFMVGNGIGCHPNQTGHDKLAAEVIATYSEGYTAQDETIANAKVALEAVAALVAEYYDEAYAYAYDYADMNGYIDELDNQVDALRGTLMEIAWDVNSSTEISDELKAELIEEFWLVDKVLSDIEEILLFDELDELDADAWNSILDLLAKLDVAMANILDVAEVAGGDFVEGYVIPALEAAKAKLENEIIPALKVKLEEAVEAGTEWLMAKLDETYDALVDAACEAIAEYAPKAAEWLYNYLLNNPEEVIAFVQDYGPYATAFVEKYSEEIMMVLGFLAVTYGDDVVEYIIENHKDILETMCNLVREYGDEAWALIEVYADATGLTGLITEKLETVNSAVQDALEAKLEVLEAELEALKAQFDAKREELENAAEEVKAEIEKSIEEIESAIEEVEQAIEDVKTAIEEVKAEIEKAIAEIDEEIKAAIEGALGDLGEKITAILEDTGIALEEKLALIGEEVASVAKEALELLAEEALNIWDELYYDATHGELTVDNDTYYVSIGDTSAVDMTGSEGDNSFSAKFAEALGLDLPNQYVSLAEKDLTVGDVRYILDETYVPDEYTLDIREYLDEIRDGYIAEIAKADIITVSLGSDNINSFVVYQLDAIMTGGEPFVMDWSRYVGEEGVAYVEEALAKVKAEISAMGLDAALAGMIPGNMTAADLITFMVECYAYGYASFSFDYAEVLNGIHEISPDAEVIVIGMYNPMDEMALELNGETVVLGEYVDYFVELVDLQYAIYTMLTPNTTYVEIPDTETILDAALNGAETVPMTTYLYAMLKGGITLQASEAGHEYIKDQILNAFEITNNVCKHEGGEATCTAKAVCDLCGREYGDVDAENHVNTEIINATEPGCDVEGYTGDTFCKDCETTVAKGEAIPATEAHVDDNGAWEIGAEGHFHTCGVCGKVFDKAPHANTEVRDAIPATCIKTGYSGDIYCADCGAFIEKGKETPVDASNHQGKTELRDVVDPTCIHTGYSGNTYCLDCGEISKTGSVTPATGKHIVSGANCHYRGSCEICGIILGPLDESVHCGDTEIRGAYEPTAVKEGYTGDTHCEGCGALLAKGETIPALGVKIDLDALEGTDEGDDSSIVLYLDKACTVKVTDPAQLADGMTVYYTVEAVEGKVVTEVGATGVSKITNEYFVISDLGELNLVPEYALAGDFDMNGAVNILDAIWMVRYVAGWKSDADMWTITECIPGGDTDANGLINALDAINLAKSLTGHTVEIFPTEQSNFVAYIIEG